MTPGHDPSDALGFTWDHSLAHLSARPGTRERAVWRFQKSLPGYVWDAAVLEGNPFTYPEVQTLLEGVTVGGRRLSDERQVLRLAAAANELAELVRSGSFHLGKDVSDRLNLLIASNEALEAGMFRGEGRETTSVAVYLGELGTYHPPPTEPGGANLRDLYRRGLNAIAALGDPFEQAVAYFLFAALCQLYLDGNKRTGRYVASGHLMSHGFDALGVPAARRVEFNTKMARFLHFKDGTEMFQFLVSCYEETR